MLNTVEELEAKGYTFEEIVARLKQKYSRQTEQVWTDISKLRWLDCTDTQEFLMKFGKLRYELHQVTAKEKGRVDQTRLMKLFKDSLPHLLKVTLASAGKFDNIDDLQDHFESTVRSADREDWVDRHIPLAPPSRPPQSERRYTPAA